MGKKAQVTELPEPATTWYAVTVRAFATILVEVEDTDDPEADADLALQTAHDELPSFFLADGSETRPVSDGDLETEKRHADKVMPY